MHKAHETSRQRFWAVVQFVCETTPIETAGAGLAGAVCGNCGSVVGGSTRFAVAVAGWGACVMWLPFAGPVFNWWKRRREFARGMVWFAATICARRPSAAPNAAGQRKAES